MNGDDIGSRNINDVSSSINGDVIFGRKNALELNENSLGGTEEDDSSFTDGKYDCFYTILRNLDFFIQRNAVFLIYLFLTR